MSKAMKNLAVLFCAVALMVPMSMTVLATTSDSSQAEHTAAQSDTAEQTQVTSEGEGEASESEGEVSAELLNAEAERIAKARSARTRYAISGGVVFFLGGGFYLLLTKKGKSTKKGKKSKTL